MYNKPFLLRPSGKDYVWGGQRINSKFEKHLDISPLAETWECSTHPDGPSYVASGEYMGMMLADVIYHHPEFLGKKFAGHRSLPIIIKFIDAQNDLSLQVHPNDGYAFKHENGQLGKSEMWYILDAKQDTKIIYGLNCTIEKNILRKSIDEGHVTKYMRKVPVKQADAFYIPAGTIHAIGAGALLVEIQQSSNLTYRLYDYDRLDKSGKKRELHVEKALEVANLKSGTEAIQSMRVLNYSPGAASELLCRCKYFEVYRLLVDTKRKHEVFYRSDELGYRVLLCIKGCGNLMYEEETMDVCQGNCVFVPAASSSIKMQGQFQFLDVRG